MRPTVEPKSDQLNFDDVATESLTVTITAVKKGAPDQPVELHNAETLVHGYLGYAGVVPAATEATDRGLAALRTALHGAAEQ